MLREQAALLPPSLCTATAPCLSGCWTPAVSHSPGLAASHTAVQHMEAWSRAMQPQGRATSLPCAFKLPPKSSSTDVFEGCRGGRGSWGEAWMESALRRGLAPALGSSLENECFSLQIWVWLNNSEQQKNFTSYPFLWMTSAWWQDDWACQGWHCCVQLFTSPQCLCSFIALLTSLLGLSVQTHLGCGLSRWALSWPQSAGWLTSWYHAIREAGNQSTNSPVVFGVSLSDTKASVWFPEWQQSQEQKVSST